MFEEEQGRLLREERRWMFREEMRWMFGENRGWMVEGERGGVTMDDVEKLHQKVRPRREHLQRRVEARRTKKRDAIIVSSRVTPAHCARASLNPAKNALGAAKPTATLQSPAVRQRWWRMR
jgi:hypothetical protein